MLPGNFQNLEASGARMRGATRSRNLIHDLAEARLLLAGHRKWFQWQPVEIIGRESIISAHCRSKLESRKTGSRVTRSDLHDSNNSLGFPSADKGASISRDAHVTVRRVRAGKYVIEFAIEHARLSTWPRAFNGAKSLPFQVLSVWKWVIFESLLLFRTKSSADFFLTCRGCLLDIFPGSQEFWRLLKKCISWLV